MSMEAQVSMETVSRFQVCFNNIARVDNVVLYIHVDQPAILLWHSRIACGCRLPNTI